MKMKILKTLVHYWKKLAKKMILTTERNLVNNLAKRIAVKLRLSKKNQKEKKNQDTIKQKQLKNQTKKLSRQIKRGKEVNKIKVDLNQNKTKEESERIEYQISSLI